MSGRSHSRLLVLSDSDQEDQEGYNPSLEGYSEDYELYGSQGDDEEPEEPEVEVREERREPHRSGRRGRDERGHGRPFGHRRLTRMIEGLTNTMREMVDAFRPRGRRSTPQPRLQRSQSMTIGTKRMTALREFKRLNPPHFNGDAGLLVAEEWLRSITQHLGTLGIEDDGQRVLLAVF